MSQKNSGGGSGLGVLLGGIAALITALGGLFSYTNQPSPNSPPTPSPSPSSSPRPTRPNPSVSSTPSELCPSKMTFGELDAFHSRNSLQAKDICDNHTMILTGYLISSSVYECSHVNAEKEAIQTRCLTVYHENIGGGLTKLTAISEEEKQMFVDINRSLYQHGNHSIQIKANISFKKEGQYQIIDYGSDMKILTYQPLKKT